MAETLHGTAFIWGVNLSGTIAGSVIASIAKVQSYTFERASDKEYLMNENGENVGRADFNVKKTLRTTVIPSHSGTIATAQTNAAVLLPAPGTVATLVQDTDISVVTDTWLVNSATLNRSNRQIAAIDLELEAFDDNDITTAIS